MKPLVYAFFFLLCSYAVAQKTVPADSISADGLRSFHGQRIDTEGAISAAQLTEKLGVFSSYDLDDVKLTGKVEACCQAKGCWMTMRVNDTQEMRITFRDYGFFVPLESAGKTAVIQGSLMTDTTSVAELRHYAIDGGMSEAEAKQKITEPEIGLSFVADGAVIMKN